MARIVLADENALVTDLMRIFLLADGHELLVAESTEVLFGLLGAGSPPESPAGSPAGFPEKPATPDLIVLSADLEPGFAAETIAELRELVGDGRLPVLVTVPPGAPEVERELSGLVAVRTLAKPFDRESFLARVRDFLLSARAGVREDEAAGPVQVATDSEVPEEDEGRAAPTVQDIVKGTSFRDIDQLRVGEHIGAWLSEHGRAIVEHEIARYVHESGERILSEVAWRVVPEMAETMLRDEIRRITDEVEN